MDDIDDDRFAPLTESELAAVPAFDDAAKDEGECVMPVPADALAPPDAHPKLGKPSARWTYLDASGALLFEVWRFNLPDGGKEFRPLSLWSDASGAFRWRWEAVPAPRPLYGLNRLAAKPDASMVICEGEKAADAAARIFPESIAVTSPNGAKSASSADWEPLAGQRVLIWPDADEPGGKYANAVAAILYGQDCEVSIIDAVALASLAPDGGQRDPVKGWDAAEAAAEWENLGALREAAVGHAKPFEGDAAKPNGGADAAQRPDGPAANGHDATVLTSDDAGHEREITRLSKLKIIEYERERIPASEALRIRASVLDKLVRDSRPADIGQGRPLVLPEPEPWPSPVNGVALVSELMDAIRKYVILTGNALAVALWVLHAFCFDAFACTPRLAITAPEKQCGKTTLLDIIGLLVPRSLSTANISTAATFRTIEGSRPVLLID